MRMRREGHLRSALLLVVLFLSAAAVYLVVVSMGKGGARGFQGVLDVNAASAAELDRVPYMTPQMAEGIVAGRPWRNLDDLIEVSGIGEKTLEKVRPYLEIEE